jgi:hypothetical protein
MRPDIAYAVGMVSRFMSDPHLEHWNAVLRFSITPKPAGVSKLPNQQHHLEWAVSPMFPAWRLVHERCGS